MREIKFRAWHNEDECMIVSQRGVYTALQHCMGLAQSPGFSNIDNQPKPERYTLMQYTGLKDKNGTEIYEGDIVAVADYANWEGLYRVVWDNDNLMYMIEDAFGDREKLCEFEEYLVKGNIYENPELLE